MTTSHTRNEELLSDSLVAQTRIQENFCEARETRCLFLRFDPHCFILDHLEKDVILR